MAGLHELRFTEEKPLLRSQDAELVSLVTALAPAPQGGVMGCFSGSLRECVPWVHACAGTECAHGRACRGVCAGVGWYRCAGRAEHSLWLGVNDVCVHVKMLSIRANTHTCVRTRTGTCVWVPWMCACVCVYVHTEVGIVPAQRAASAAPRERG